MRTVVLILLCAVGTSGCAVAAAKGPGPGPVRMDRKPDCNDGKGAVVLDGLGATVLGVGALAAFAGDEGGLGAAFGLATVGLIASAVAGSRSADRCRLAEEQWGNLLLTGRTDARRPTPPIVLDEDGDPIATTRRPVAVTPPVVAPVPPPSRPVAVTPPPPTRPVTPPSTPVAAPASADPEDDDEPAAASDDPSDWSAFWREVTR